MTAPIQFPTIQPAQYVPPQQGREDLGRLLLAVTEARHNFALRKQELELERQRTESGVAGQEQQTKESKQRVKDAEFRREQEDENLTAHDVAARHFTDALTSPTGLTPATLNAAKLNAAKENPKLAAKIYASIDAFAQGAEQSRTAIATRREGETKADVGEKTAGAAVKVGQNAPRVQAEQLRGEQLRNTYQALQNAGFDASRISAADALWVHSGKTWGEVRRQLGFGNKVPGGLPDDAVFAGKDDSSAAQRASMGQGLAVANAALNALGNEGLKPAAFGVLNSNPSGIVSGALTAGVSGMLGEQQQQLVAGYAGFNAMTQAALPRGATSDKDAAEMRRAFTTLAGDAPKVKAQKALLRNAFVEAFQTATPGSHAAALENMVKIAKRFGVTDPALLAPFYNMRTKFKAADSTVKAGKSPDDAIIDREAGVP